MTKEQIEEKAYESYPAEFMDEGINPRLHIDRNESKREGYIKALTELESPKLYGWVARDRNGMLHLFDVEPKRIGDYWWNRDYNSESICNEKAFPDITWESDPIEVEILIRRV